MLEAERDAVEAELDDCDGKIKLARSKFERQLQRLAQRDQMVKASAKDCEREQHALDAERAQQACSGALLLRIYRRDEGSRRRLPRSWTRRIASRTQNRCGRRTRSTTTMKA